MLNHISAKVQIWISNTYMSDNSNNVYASFLYQNILNKYPDMCHRLNTFILVDIAIPFNKGLTWSTGFEFEPHIEH